LQRIAKQPSQYQASTDSERKHVQKADVAKPVEPRKVDEAKPLSVSEFPALGGIAGKPKKGIAKKSLGKA